jgi:spore coat polysaccharide biosynthesis protein SpsF
MGSTRLPGKVLKDLAGETMLTRVVQRLRRATKITDLLVATTDLPADDAIVAECRKSSVPVSRGDQDDVLDRYFRAAQLTKAEVVVRITSDCPLIDPEITDKTIAAFLDARPDYASNVLTRTYPRGLDTEVMSVGALERAWRQSQKKHEREHVTPYIYEHPAEFKLLSVASDEDYSQHRWTVDTPEDLEFVRAVYGHFEKDAAFSWRDILKVLERHRALAELSRAVVQQTLKG